MNLREAAQDVIDHYQGPSALLHAAIIRLVDALRDDARVVARPDLLRQVLEAHDSCDQTRIIEAMDAVRDAVYPAIASASNVAQHPNVKDIRDFAAAVNSDRVATLKHALRVVVERLDALVSAPTPKSATQRERVLHGLLVEAKGHLEGRKMSQLSHSPQALIAIINALPAPDVSPPVVARHPNDSLRASTNSGQAANVDGASHCAHDWISGARLTYCRLCGADAPAANIPTLKARVLSMLHEGRSMYPGCGVAIDAIISRTTHLFDRAALEVKPKIQQHGWIPVGERLPVTDKLVATRYADGDYGYDAYIEGGWEMYENALEEFQAVRFSEMTFGWTEPTHWMPIPDVESEVQQQGEKR